MFLILLLRLTMLNHEYAESNRLYFDNKLPPAKIVLTHNLKDDNGSVMATTFCIRAGGKLNCTIEIDPDKNPVNRTAIMTLYHEQCHVKLWGIDINHPHGELFQDCMHDLATKGAFDDLW